VPLLQLPSAVGSLKAERSILPHRVAEQRVQFDDGAIQVLDGDSGAHGCIVPFVVACVKGAGKIYLLSCPRRLAVIAVPSSALGVVAG